MSSLPSWYLPLLAYFIFSTSYSLMLRRLGQTSKIPLGLIPFLMVSLVVYPLALIIALLSGNLSFHFSSWAIIYLVIQAVLIGTYNVVPFRINKHIDATQYVVIGNIYTPITVSLGVFFLQESFGGKQFLGTILLIIGAMLVAAKSFRTKRWRLDRHSWELILMSILFGVGLAAEKGALNYMSVYTYLVIGYGMQFLVTALWSYKDWKVIPTIKKARMVRHHESRFGTQWPCFWIYFCTNLI